MKIGSLQPKRPSSPPPKFPFMKINHKRAWFENPDGERIGSTLDAVILGQLRSRIMWPGQFGSGERPVCKSDDSVTGTPLENFPWNESKFAEVESNKLGIPCEECSFKEWDKDFGRARCQETWTIALLVVQNGNVSDTPWLLNFTSSGITTLRDYFRPMIEQKTHPFNYVTRIKLHAVAKGDSKWSKPEFARLGDTSYEQHNFYVGLLRQVKKELRPAPLSKGIVPIKLG
ncbi:hypothetical protein Mbo2_055 [Rhodococcus phage Mbo2]|uniref:Uncharacterized protein n=1 Tax=Rhodococcus phage Mbo2 TaxID=2936911 RepID=A0A9E7LF30_9CAUD|nr:hypothetical protein Mbo2_055 [Rhodococcus phage Mbo2]